MMRFLKKLLAGWIVFIVASAVAALVVRKRLPSHGSESDNDFAVVAAMDGVVFESTAPGLGEGHVTAFMGGVELDLLDANLSPGAMLVLRAVMGGMDVIVPSHWRVEVMGRSVLGGIANLTNPDDADRDAPVLLIDALAVMGGIEIHHAEVD